ncbi:MAG: hypothetical protein MUP97_15920 [Acidimicrobiia bacterium]|nr:hypothetical protein [Acidimicrobiia bacterium]
MSSSSSHPTPGSVEEAFVGPIHHRPRYRIAPGPTGVGLEDLLTPVEAHATVVLGDRYDRAARLTDADRTHR